MRSRTNLVIDVNPSNFPIDSFFFLKFTFGPKFFFLRPLCDASHPKLLSTPATSSLDSSSVKKFKWMKTPGKSKPEGPCDWQSGKVSHPWKIFWHAAQKT